MSSASTLVAESFDDENEAKAQILAEEQVANGKARPSKVSGEIGKVSGKIRAINKHIAEIGSKPRGVKDRERLIRDKLSKLRAKESETEIRITLAGAILFNFDTHNLRPDAVSTLEDLVTVLIAYRKKVIRIEGHTDSVGTNIYNEKLSEQRANSVYKWLRSRNFEAKKVNVKGYGELQPIDTNESAAGRQQNRRVEVVIEK